MTPPPLEKDQRRTATDGATVRVVVTGVIVGGLPGLDLAPLACVEHIDASGLVSRLWGTPKTLAAFWPIVLAESNAKKTRVTPLGGAFSGNLDEPAGNTGEVRWQELAASGTNYVGIKAPDALAGDPDSAGDEPT